jgi:hypothetical protein
MTDPTVTVPTDLGWQIVDPEGNIVDSGPLTIAEMTTELAESLGLNSGE